MVSYWNVFLCRLLLLFYIFPGFQASPHSILWWNRKTKIIFLTSHGSIKFLLHKREKRMADCPLELYKSNSFSLLKASNLEMNYDTYMWEPKRNCWVNWRADKTKRVLWTWMGLGNHDPGNRARIKYFHLLIHSDWIFNKIFTIKTRKKARKLRHHKQKKVLKAKFCLDLENHLTKKLLPSVWCLSSQVPEYQREAVKLWLQ